MSAMHISLAPAMREHNKSIVYNFRNLFFVSSVYLVFKYTQECQRLHTDCTFLYIELRGKSDPHVKKNSEYSKFSNVQKNVAVKLHLLEPHL